MQKRLWLAALAGLLVGKLLQGAVVQAEIPNLAFGLDSASGAAVSIQTNGTNALKVVSR